MQEGVEGERDVERNLHLDVCDSTIHDEDAVAGRQAFGVGAGAESQRIGQERRPGMNELFQLGAEIDRMRTELAASDTCDDRALELIARLRSILGTLETERRRYRVTRHPSVPLLFLIDKRLGNARAMLDELDEARVEMRQPLLLLCREVENAIDLLVRFERQRHWRIQ